MSNHSSGTSSWKPWKAPTVSTTTTSLSNYNGQRQQQHHSSGFSTTSTILAARPYNATTNATQLTLRSVVYRGRSAASLMPPWSLVPTTIRIGGEQTPSSASEKPLSAPRLAQRPLVVTSELKSTKMPNSVASIEANALCQAAWRARAEVDTLYDQWKLNNPSNFDVLKGIIPLGGVQSEEKSRGPNANRGADEWEEDDDDDEERTNAGTPPIEQYEAELRECLDAKAAGRGLGFKWELLCQLYGEQRLNDHIAAKLTY